MVNIAESCHRVAAEDRGLSLVMPMAGRGSRFSEFEALPKPLIKLNGKPFFWWAVESARRLGDINEIVFVVLEEHVEKFAIDASIRHFYPDARIERLAKITSGAAETAAVGIAALRSKGPIAVCDSDHGFDVDGCNVEQLLTDRDGLLLCFKSQDAAYSFACVDEMGDVTCTVEKQVASDRAIAGCYLFSTPETFLTAFEAYRVDCPYEEPFVSGVYNKIIESGGRVGQHILRRHVSFGTPAEFARAGDELAQTSLWAA